MPKPEMGMPPAMTYMTPALGTQLVMGKNLIRLRAVVTSAEQVPAVTVTGYDPTLTVPVIGPFPSIPSTSQSIDPATLPPLGRRRIRGHAILRLPAVPLTTRASAMSYAESVAGGHRRRPGGTRG